LHNVLTIRNAVISTMWAVTFVRYRTEYRSEEADIATWGVRRPTTRLRSNAAGFS